MYGHGLSCNGSCLPAQSFVTVRENKMRLLILSIALLAFGCASPMPMLEARQTFIDIPPTSEEAKVIATARVGDSVVVKAKLYERPAKILSGEIVDKQLLTGTTELGKGQYQALYDVDGWVYYEAVEGVSVSGAQWNPASYGLVHYRPKDEYYTAALMESKIMFMRASKPLGPDHVNLISDGTYVDAELPSFRQEFVYNGRAGDVVRFMYREYKDDMARPAFTQNLVYDLGESSRIMFRSVEIDVVEAKNSEIKYRLLSGFPDYE